MIKITLYLSHGHVIKFQCKEFTMRKDNFTGKYSSAEWKGADWLVSFNLGELIAYEAEEVTE